MELDLSEYDQVDEIKLMMENNEQFYGDGVSKFLVTLSSCSDQTSLDETNCENDFVFLPAPAKPQGNNSPASNATPSTTRSQSSTQVYAGHSCTDHKQQVDGRPSASNDPSIVTQPQSIAPLPLIAINTNTGSNNPFGNCPKETIQVANEAQHPLRPSPTDTCSSKPMGLLEIPTAMASNNSSKLTELMQQIVTRSDLIYIAVPCAYCHEPVACPPSDISSWLNHMSKQHNCKLCPVCSKLIGLGPRRDIEIMKRHVMEHFDEDWLERRAYKVSFTFGLQQQWFSGNRCSVKESRYR